MSYLTSIQSDKFCQTHRYENSVCTQSDKKEKLLRTLLVWLKRVNHNRRTRRRLASLSDAALKDIGVTRADVYEELHKPVWK